MPALYVIVGFLVVQRLAELGFARRNQRALVTRGAIEVGRGHYPAMVALHAGWLLALPVTIDARTPASLSLLAVFVLLRVVCGRGRNPTFSPPRVTVLRLQDARTFWPCSRSWP